MGQDFVTVTELSGEKVASEQIERMLQRYVWAGTFCEEKDVLEVACGSGQGIGLLLRKAKSVTAGDFSSEILEIARKHYKNRVELSQFSGEAMPFFDQQFDVVILFEAIYYIPSAEKFVAEAKRVLRPGGVLLIVTANRDLYDFTPSPFSHEYYGVTGLHNLLSRHNFSTTFFGSYSVLSVSARQKILRPLKKIATALGIIPKTMSGKQVFKKIFYGDLVHMPPEIQEGMYPYTPPDVIEVDKPNKEFKVLHCIAKKQ